MGCTGADLGILRGGGVRVQVHGNFHILTSENKKTSGGGGLTPPPWIRHWCIRYGVEVLGVEGRG